VKGLRLPPRSPNWNAFAERWVRSVKEECLSHLILFGERSLRRAPIQFQEHYHEERNHQGKSNVLLFPAPAPLEPGGRVASAVENVLAAYSDTTVAPHEYFDQTGSNPGHTYGTRDRTGRITRTNGITTICRGGFGLRTWVELQRRLSRIRRVGIGMRTGWAIRRISMMLPAPTPSWWIRVATAGAPLCTLTASIMVALVVVGGVKAEVEAGEVSAEGVISLLCLILSVMRLCRNLYSSRSTDPRPVTARGSHGC